VIVVLLVSYTVVAAIQGISWSTGHDRVGEVAGLFSPYLLVNGVQHFLFDVGSASRTPPEGAGMGLLYVAVSLLTVLAATAALVARYRRVNP
jgi:ABC-2 type transport system permease protein